ncbi:MAG: hypothetical protein WC227_00605 [Patescibacteria group bacterium]|jgi:hypothetical protein
MVNVIEKIGFHLVNAAQAGVQVGLKIDGKDNFDYGEYVHAIYQFALKLGGTLTVLMIIYAGFVYMTSQGDNTKINTAKDVFMGTLLGYVLLLTLGMILDFLGMPTFNIS